MIDREPCVLEEHGGVLELLLSDICSGTDPELLHKERGEIPGTSVHGLCEVIYGERIMEVALDVLTAVPRDEGAVAVSEAEHILGEGDHAQAHEALNDSLVLLGCDLPDEAVADGESEVLRNAAINGCPGYERDPADAKIDRLPEPVLGEGAHLHGLSSGIIHAGGALWCLSRRPELKGSVVLRLVLCHGADLCHVPGLDIVEERLLPGPAGGLWVDVFLLFDVDLILEILKDPLFRRFDGPFCAVHLRDLS